MPESESCVRRKVSIIYFTDFASVMNYLERLALKYAKTKKCVTELINLMGNSISRSDTELGRTVIKRLQTCFAQGSFIPAHVVLQC